MVWAKDAAAGVGLLVFMACAFVLANAGHALLAVS